MPYVAISPPSGTSKDYWENWYVNWYYNTNDREVDVNISSVLCKELINNMTDITEEQRNYMLQYYEGFDTMLCPNTTQFEVSDKVGSHFLSLTVRPDLTKMDKE